MALKIESLETENSNLIKNLTPETALVVNPLWEDYICEGEEEVSETAVLKVIY